MILIIDDDNTIRSSLTFMLRRAGYEPMAVEGPKEAMRVVRKCEPQLILMDMNFSLSTSGEEGLTLLQQVKIFQPDVPVILMTAWGSINLAVRGMRAGAFDFVTKPWNNAALLQRIETALTLSIDKPEKIKATKPVGSQNDSFRTNIIGRNKKLLACLDIVERVAKTNASVLITGESGTGKELIAEAIHRNSLRATKPFVKVNLGGISQSLFESEMFGHKRGAFTDAKSDRKGRFELADGGTIFLDEIGDLDLSSQVKLLRVLQDQTFEPLGDSRTRKVDVRVVSATNADLPRKISEHTFREDLFYRINLITIHLPSLDERREDIPLLVNHFAKKIRRVTFSDEAMKALMEHHYSGNIRELKNLVERTLLICQQEVIERQKVEDILRQAPQVVYQEERGSYPDGAVLSTSECQQVKAALERFDGNVSRAADWLGISRQSLYRRIQKYGL